MEKYKGTMIEATCEPPIRNFPLRQGKNSFRIPRILDAGRHNSSQNAEIDQSLVFSNEVREKAAGILVFRGFLTRPGGKEPPDARVESINDS
jgi:hypothetical protein